MLIDKNSKILPLNRVRRIFLNDVVILNNNNIFFFYYIIVSRALGVLRELKHKKKKQKIQNTKYIFEFRQLFKIYENLLTNK